MSTDDKDWPSGESLPAPSAVFEPTASKGERFQVGSMLGQGGMGRVDAVHDNTLRRDVARKVLRPSLAGSTGEQQRLLREAIICAQLEHPGIVPVYDAGELEDGSPFYTMRVVRGRSLAEALREGTLDQRLALVRPVLMACEAVAYAHRVGIVHRDVKPSNILLGELGETQVVDWGLARPLAEDSGWSAILDHGDLTMAGSLVGTPRYMSPEQARGEPADRRSDVYSLGATLYEVVAGTSAFEGSSRDVLEAIRSRPPVPLAERVPAAPAGLVAIVDRAMAQDPNDRYVDASELAAELAHWLDTRWADALTAGARAKAAQQRVLMGLLAVLFVGLGSAWGLSQLARERDRAVEAEGLSRDAETTANANLAMALLAQGRRAVLHNARPEAEVLAVRALELGGSEPDARGVLAAFAMTARPRVVRHFTLPRCEQVALQSDGGRLACRTFEGVSVWDTDSGDVAWERDGDFTSVGWAGVSLAATSHTGELLVWDEVGVIRFVKRPNIEVPNLASVGAPLVVNDTASWFLVADTETKTLSHLSWCPDAVNQVADARLGLLASACNTTVFLSGDLGDAPVPYVLPDTNSLGVTALRILGEDRILVGTRSGSLRLIEGGEQVWSTATEVGAIRRITLDDSGRGFVVGEQATRSFWLESGLVGERLPSGIDDARVHPDGLLTRSGAEVRVWALPAEEKPRRFQGRGGIADVALTPDGEVLAASSGASETVAWSTSDGRVIGRIEWPEGVGKAVSFNATGTELRAAAMGGTYIERRTVPGWEILARAEGGPRRRIGRAGRLTWGLSFSRNSLWVYEDGVHRQDLAVYGETLFDGQESHGGGHALLLSDSGAVWRLGEGLGRLGEYPGAISVAPFEDHRLAVGFKDRLEVHDGQSVVTVPVNDTVLDLVVCPDQRCVVAGTRGGRILVFDVSGAPLAVMRGHRERVVSLAFDGTGTVLASGSWDAEARLWDMTVLSASVEELAAAVDAAWPITLEEAMAVEFL